jgi:late competence protein required for DNA uptake (superfamily II DNA/RNA helicase)
MRSKKLLLQQHQQQPQQQQLQVDSNPLQYEKETEDNNREKKMLQDLEQEIECPRCYDIMSLSSDFSGLCYFCQECNLSLLIN